LHGPLFELSAQKPTGSFRPLSVVQCHLYVWPLVAAWLTFSQGDPSIGSRSNWVRLRPPFQHVDQPL